MSKFVVPDLVKSDVMLPLIPRKDEETRVHEVIDLLRSKVKAPLGPEDERSLRQAVVCFRSTIRRKYQACKRGKSGMDRFLQNEAEWLATAFNLPVSLKPLKLPPPTATADPQMDGGHIGDGVNFRQPSNYCLMCSSELPIGLPEGCLFLITSRLAKSICTAMNLKSTAEVNFQSNDVNFQSNLVDCSLCSDCYDKVIEVNDIVKELEQIQINLHKLASDMDQIMTSGMETRKKLPFELHGVNERYITPAELRQEIIQFRNHHVMEAVDKKARQATKIPFTTTTRGSTTRKNCSQGSGSHGTSGASLASPPLTELSHDLDPSCVSASFPRRMNKPFTRNVSNGSSRLLSMKKRLAFLRKRNPFLNRNHQIGNPNNRISRNRSETVIIHASDNSTDETNFDVFTPENLSTTSMGLPPKIEGPETDYEPYGDGFGSADFFGTDAPETGSASSSATFHLWERVQDGGLQWVSTVPQDDLIPNIILYCKEPDCNYQSLEASDILAHASKLHSENSTPSEDICYKIQDSEDGYDKGLDTNRKTVLKTREPGPRALEDQNILSMPCLSGHGPASHGPSTKNIPPKFRCKILGCKYKTAVQERLMGHVLGFHRNDPRPYKCNFQSCTKTFKEYSKVVKHRKLHGIIRKSSRPFPCTQCTKGYMTAREFQVHQKSHLPGIEPPPVSCHICSKKIPSKQALRDHIRTHQPKPFQCTVESCSATFRRQSILQRHLRMCHLKEFPELGVEPAPKVICDECGKVLTTIVGLRQHMIRRHSANKEPKLQSRRCYATNCNFTTENFEELKLHRQSHTDLELAPRFPCTQCSKKFHSHLSLKSHERTHDPNFQIFQCEYCGKKDSDSHHFKRHVQICAGKLRKQFVCNSCKQAFATDQYLILHQKKRPNCKTREPGPDSIFCPECNKCCSSRNTLNRHVQLLHSSGDKPHKCSDCGKEFSIKMYLTRHLKESRFCPGSKGYRPDLL